MKAGKVTSNSDTNLYKMSFFNEVTPSFIHTTSRVIRSICWSWAVIPSNLQLDSATC